MEPTRCERCSSTHVAVTIKTGYGQYCRCAACGDIWHVEGPNDDRLRDIKSFQPPPPPPDHSSDR